MLNKTKHMWDQKGRLHTYPHVHTKGMKRRKIKIGEESGGGVGWWWDELGD